MGSFNDIALLCMHVYIACYTQSMCEEYWFPLYTVMFMLSPMIFLIFTMSAVSARSHI